MLHDLHANCNRKKIYKLFYLYTKFYRCFSTILKSLLYLWVNSHLKSWLFCLWELSSLFSYPLWPVCWNWYMHRISLLKNPLVHKTSGSDIILWVERNLHPHVRDSLAKPLHSHCPWERKGTSLPLIFLLGNLFIILERESITWWVCKKYVL